MALRRGQFSSFSSHGAIGGGARFSGGSERVQRSMASSSFSSYGGGSGAATGFGLGGGAMMGSGSALSSGYMRSGSGAGMGLGSGFGFGSGGSFGGGAGGFGGGYGDGGDSSAVQIVNEKQQMQTLNDRLATYLEKVRTLEATNKDLEDKLKNFHTSKVVTRDYTSFEDQLQPLRDQIIAAIIENSRVALEIDNAKLAADDFRTKYESEYTIRQSVEADILNLKGLKKECEINHTSNLQEIETLKQEIEELKKQHEEDMGGLKEEMAGTVNVNVQASESPDLARILEDLRADYESIVQRNKQDLERWFNKQVEAKEAEAIQKAEAAGGTETTKTEMTDLRRQTQSLQAELDALRATVSNSCYKSHFLVLLVMKDMFLTKASLEENLAGVDGRYQMELHRIAALVASLEEELMNIRDSMTSQNEEYKKLLNIKEQLEQEIATYKQLLEGMELGGGGASSSTGALGAGFGFGGGVDEGVASALGAGGDFGSGGYGGGVFSTGGGLSAGGHLGYGGLYGSDGAASGSGLGFALSGSGSAAPFMVNEKQQMQSLNDRLAAYLDKVRTLEATNKDLENKLKNFRTSKVISRDFTSYQKQLQPLRDQIIAAIIQNSRLALKIDNAQLAADDFRKKYEIEYIFRQTVEADILNLKKLKQEYDSHQASNNQQVEALKKEIEEMTKQHGESVSILKEEMSGTVSVDVTTTESPDLKQILDDLRAEYEDIVRSNKEELEMWFNKQVETKQAAAIQETDVSEKSKIEVTELRHQNQNLQTEMDALLVSKGALEDNLAAVNGHYQMELHRIAALVATMEGELMSIRNSITSQSEDYRNLLNVKEKLEKEITTYKQLLEGVELGAGGASSAM
ncbi:KRT36 protein, partial [Polypterus senegalus]